MIGTEVLHTSGQPVQSHHPRARLPTATPPPRRHAARGQRPAQPDLDRARIPRQPVGDVRGDVAGDRQLVPDRRARSAPTPRTRPSHPGSGTGCGARRSPPSAPPATDQTGAEPACQRPALRRPPAGDWRPAHRPTAQASAASSEPPRSPAVSWSLPTCCRLTAWERQRPLTASRGVGRRRARWPQPRLGAHREHQSGRQERHAVHGCAAE
jgi:hypothetical protein